MLSVEGLHSYYDTAPVLRGVDLHVDDGEVVGLLGRNGMGKTTLVRSIMGLDPPQVHEGRIIWGDEDLVGLPSYEVSMRGLGLVPQGRHIFGSLTVTENLQIVARGSNGSADWGIDEVFDFFPRLAERRRLAGKNLSGGEQQMLAIGRALMTNPQMLVMDEPSEGLAPVLLAMIRDRMLDIKRSGQSIFLVEQNLGLAMRLCDRLHILGETGVIVWEGTPSQLQESEEVQRLHLSM